MSQTGYFRVADVRDTVHISRSTLYRWKNRGLVTPHKIGGIVFFSIDEVRDVIRTMGDKVGDAEFG